MVLLRRRTPVRAASAYIRAGGRSSHTPARRPGRHRPAWAWRRSAPPRSAPLRSAAVRSASIRKAPRRSAQVRAAQVGVYEVGAPQIGAHQVDAAQHGERHHGPAQVGATQVGRTLLGVGAIETGTAQVGPAQVGATQGCLAEIGHDHPDAAQVGATTVRQTVQQSPRRRQRLPAAARMWRRPSCVGASEGEDRSCRRVDLQKSVIGRELDRRPAGRVMISPPGGRTLSSHLPEERGPIGRKRRLTLTERAGADSDYARCETGAAGGGSTTNARPGARSGARFAAYSTRVSRAVQLPAFSGCRCTAATGWPRFRGCSTEPSVVRGVDFSAERGAFSMPTRGRYGCRGGR